MKKLYVIMGAIGVLALLVSGAWATPSTPDFPNNTMVEAYSGSLPYGSSLGGSGTGEQVKPGPVYWYDRIGDQAIFETYGADYSAGKLTIYTNWGPNDIGYLSVISADLFVDIDPAANNGFDYAIKMTNIANQAAPSEGSSLTFTLQQIVSASPYNTSIDERKNLGGVYGGQYDINSPKAIPVNATSTSTQYTTVTWTNIVGNNPDFGITFNLADISGFDPVNNGFAFIWGTGTCANDTAEGFKGPTGTEVPVPGALLLFGTGLIGLGAVRRWNWLS